MGAIVGIDLAGVPTRETGFAVLGRWKRVKTKVLYKDADIISETVRARPKLVTIDAPLGLPKGRCCIEYDCKCKKHGYIREAERQLKKMGIQIFPCGFPRGMQQLTKRGIKLRKKFERLGYKVIETYPGSAQDILKIPRKRLHDHKKLQQGLVDYGFRGHVAKKDITHHELDAITSAFVGQLYLEGNYIALGIPEESQIITAKPKGQKHIKDYGIISADK
jgi:predicted nuclease with RNAse H fold